MMNSFNCEKIYLQNKFTICCEYVNKMKQYANLLRVEMTQLNSMQLKCNKLLDNFYKLRNDFDFLVNEMLPIKYLGKDDSFLTEEHINEFSMFFRSVWQTGKLKFSEKGKKAKHMGISGYPFSEVTSTIQSFVEEALHHKNYTYYHYECISLLQTLSLQVNFDLQENNLGSADACFYQLTYLELANPFLDELCQLIHQYLLLEEVYTPKQFVDTVILGIPHVETLTLDGDVDDMVPYRFVVDLLNGQLLDKDILDHTSDIKPVVEDDVNLKRSAVVMKVVEWILQQYFYVQNPCRNVVLGFAEFDTCTDILRESPVRNTFLNTSIAVPTQRRMVRRKPSRLSNSSSASDLKPIKLHTLQMPLLPPLL